MKYIPKFKFKLKYYLESPIQYIGQKLQTTTKEGKTAKVQDSSKSTEKVLRPLVITVQNGHRK